MKPILNLEEEFFIRDNIRKIRLKGYTKVCGYHLEEMNEQTDLTLYRLFQNIYRAKQADKLDELIERYLNQLENKK